MSTTTEPAVNSAPDRRWLESVTLCCIAVVCRTVSPSTRLSVSPIRPVKSPIMTRKQVSHLQECRCLSTQPDWSQEVAPQRTVSEPVVVTEHGRDGLRLHHCAVLLQICASAEVLPPWKQGDYVAEASYTTVSSVTSVSSATRLHMEKHWEQQVSATREVRVVELTHEH